MSDFPKMSLRFSRELRIFFNDHHDHCSNCGKPFDDNETTHLGCRADGSFIYACSQCKTQVEETVIRYGYSKRSYERPPHNATLWRYLDFSKFVSMLLKKSLFFSKTSLFKDPFEGAIGMLDNKDSYDRSMLFALLVSHMTAPTKDSPPLPVTDEITNRALKIVSNSVNNVPLAPDDVDLVTKSKVLATQISNIGLQRRDYTFVNCWHESVYESDAMWMLYSKDIKNALAVRTTFENLYHSLNKDPDIQIGRVNYIDFTKKFSATNSTQWYKRISFAHEKEVRAVFLNQKYKDLPGVEIPVDLDTLIDKIYVSPSAPGWFVDVVKDITIKYGLNKEVLHSELSKKPMY